MSQGHNGILEDNISLQFLNDFIFVL